MKGLAAVFLLAAASVAGSADKVHTGRDLDTELQGLAWLLGNWEGKGKFVDVDFNEWTRYWPSPDGSVLYERAFAADTSGTVIHDDLMVIWSAGGSLRCNFYEASPPRFTEYDLTLTDGGLEFAPRREGGAALAFTKKDKDAFSYVYNARGADGAEQKATCEVKRSGGDFPAPTAPEPAKALAPLSGAIGEYTGKWKSSHWGGGEGRVTGEPILGGEVLELCFAAGAGELKDEDVRAWCWYDADREAWSAHILTPGFGVYVCDAEVKDGQVTARTEVGGGVFRWSWKDGAATYRMSAIEEKRETVKLSFEGRQVRKD